MLGQSGSAGWDREGVLYVLFAPLSGGAVAHLLAGAPPLAVVPNFNQRRGPWAPWVTVTASSDE